MALKRSTAGRPRTVQDDNRGKVEVTIRLAGTKRNIKRQVTFADATVSEVTSKIERLGDVG